MNQDRSACLERTACRARSEFWTFPSSDAQGIYLLCPTLVTPLYSTTINFSIVYYGRQPLFRLTIKERNWGLFLSLGMSRYHVTTASTNHRAALSSGFSENSAAKDFFNPWFSKETEALLVIFRLFPINIRFFLEYFSILSSNFAEVIRWLSILDRLLSRLAFLFVCLRRLRFFSGLWMSEFSSISLNSVLSLEN